VRDISRSEVFLKNSEILFVDDEKELLLTVDQQFPLPVERPNISVSLDLLFVKL